MRWRGLLRLVLVLLVVLAAASWGVSLALRGGWARRSLLNRLSASFGRPVEVGQFGFSLMAGPQLEADSVTVSEDPRFGNEYFLRADQITASLRWAALLRGRVEFRSLSLSHPSLNLVRATDGAWNIENWLPPARTAVAGNSAMIGQPNPAAGVRVAHITVDGGRINFKRGVEKLQFALVEVSGNLDQDPSGRWSLDLEAYPTRASVALQEVGSLRLRGTVAGTSARLRPAHLSLAWADASLADALRLAFGTDYGARGTLNGEFSASIEDSPSALSAPQAQQPWQLQGAIRLASVHRWDFTAHPADPAINLSASATWRPGEPALEITHYAVEAPHSRLVGAGRLDWVQGFSPSVQLDSYEIGLADLLAWRRAFVYGLADDLAVDGTIVVNANVSGWPPRIDRAALTGRGATIRTAAVQGPLRVEAMRADMKRGVFVLDPVPVSFPGVPASERSGPARGRVQAAALAQPSAGTLLIGAEIGPFRSGASPRDWPYRVTLSGATSRAQDVAAAAAAFGWPIRTDWTFAGAAQLQLAWTGSFGATASPPLGKLDLSDLKLSTALLNQPVTVSAASVELGPDQRSVKLTEARAFGAHWSGTLQRRLVDRVWTFDLTADHLDADDLDRWLGPRARPGFFERILPFGSASVPPSVTQASIAQIRGRGRLRIEELELAPLRVTKLDATAAIDGRSVHLSRAQAEFYGGRISGDFGATVSAEPSYSFRGAIDRVNVALLAEASPLLEGQFAGLVSGDLKLAAKGIGRQSLLGSLQGDGTLRARDAVVPIVNSAWGDLGEAGVPQAAAVGRFATGTAAFRIADGSVHLNPLRLADRDHGFEVTGAVDFSRKLDLHVRPIQLLHGVETPSARSAEAPSIRGTEADAWTVGGTLDAPEVSPKTNVAGNAVGARR